MSPVLLVAVMSVSGMLSLIGFSSFAVLLPRFAEAWSLSSTEAGWISGAYYLGYTAAVPVLVGLTDRLDGRGIYLFSALAGAAGSFGFAFLADGIWTASLFRAVSGLALAGTYMPGLQILNARLAGPAQIRAVSWYTGCFALGSALSFMVTAPLAVELGWPAPFVVAGFGCLVAFALVAGLVRPVAPAPRPADAPRRRLLDFRPVLRNRAALSYILGYGGHSAEVLSYRAWIVAFLVFAAGESYGLVELSAIVTVFSLAGVPASVIGGEVALRLDRQRTIAAVMALSALAGAVTGFLPGVPFVLVAIACALCNILMMTDSAALTAGTVAAADPAERGATLALHTMVGFAGGFVAPVIVGIVLDLAGGRGSGLAWGLAFLVMAGFSLLGLLGMRLARPRR